MSHYFVEQQINCIFALLFSEYSREEGKQNNYNYFYSHRLTLVQTIEYKF